MGRLDGKTALVTGAGRGIGRAIALRLAADGARLAINYANSEAAAQAAVAEIEAAGGRALAVRADISDLAALEAMFAQLRRSFGTLDILVNNAARSLGGMPTLEAIGPELYDAIFATNTRGVFFVTQKAVAMMSDGGRVISLSSVAVRGTTGGLSAYAGSKSAVDAFTRVWSTELAPRRITVNSVVPGIIETDMILENLSAEARKAIVAAIPLGRIGQPGDIADIVAFLASDESRWITGQEIAANGGV
jgi:3-oxoacyl-[acyl-carrier protein] reductase